MPIFDYIAVDSTGKDAVGSLEAANRDQADTMIRSSGKLPSEITERVGSSEQTCGSGCSSCESGCGAAKLEADTSINAEQIRDVTIKVPVSVTDEQVQMALQMGSIASEAIMHGVLVCFFPTVVQDPETKQQRQAVGHASMPIINMSDIQRVVTLIQAQNAVNTKIAQAGQSGVKGAAIEAAIRGDTVKDNVMRDEVAKAQGLAGGIIVAG